MNEDWNEKKTKKTKRNAKCKKMKLVGKELVEGINDYFFCFGNNYWFWGYMWQLL
jgi:hypothetical protein